MGCVTDLLVSFYGTYIEFGPLGVCLKYSINIRCLLFDVVVKISTRVDGKGVMVQFIHSSVAEHLGCFHWIPPKQFISECQNFCIIIISYFCGQGKK